MLIYFIPNITQFTIYTHHYYRITHTRAKYLYRYIYSAKKIEVAKNTCANNRSVLYATHYPFI